MKKLLFIYNEAAGKGRVKQHLAAILNRLSQAGWLVTVCPTQGKGDAERIARELGSRFDQVVCAGGDGTLSETMSGLVNLAHPPVLGYIPAGSTNDCARNLHLPTDMSKSAMIVASDGIPRALDVGQLNEKSFIYVAAFGAFTEVAYDTPQDLKNTFGHLAYVMAGIGQLVNLMPYRLKVEYNDTVIEDDFLYGMVCNTYSVAGMMSLSANRVVLDDGLFEVVLVRKSVKIPELLSALLSLANDTPMETASVLSFETSQLTITSEKPLPWTVDGEYGGTYTVSQVGNRRRALTIIQGK